MIDKLLEKYKNIPGERFFQELFENNEYKEARKVKADIVFDVGACAGEFSAYIYDQAKLIYAIEPNSSVFKELESNVKEFDLTKIKPYRVGLAGETGMGYLSTNQGRGGCTLTAKADTTEEVPIITLAAFMKREGVERIDILKIDIEGGEDAVFKAPDFHEVQDKIQFIIGEHLSGVQNDLGEMGFKVRYSKGNQIFYR